MKKLLAILLAVVMCLSVCSVSAFAANEDIVVSATGGTANRGGTIRVPIKLDTNTGFQTLGITVGYDADVLEIVCEKHDDSKNCTGPRKPEVEKKEDFQIALDYECNNSGTNSAKCTVNPYVIQWAYALIEEDITETGEIAAITFKVKDTAAFGATKVVVTVDQASNVGKTAMTFVGGEATVTVACTSHKKDAGTVTKEPTCTEKGERTFKCSDCGAPMGTEEIAATGHNWGDWQGSADAKCGEQGEEKRVCQNDANHVETRKTDALEHLWDEGTVTKEPTCTEKGERTFRCTRTGCTGTKTEEIAATGHNWGEWVVTTEPTCTEKGEATRTCANDAAHKETKEVAATGHDWGEWEITKEPTCTEAGEEARVCKNDATHKEAEVLDALGHVIDPDSWTVTKEPTLDEEGTRTGGKCERYDECGHVAGDEAMPKLTNTLTGDKVTGFVLDEEGNAQAAELDVKFEVVDDDPFSGYVNATVLQMTPTEKDLDDLIDGKAPALGFIAQFSDDDGADLPEDKVVKFTIKLDEAALANYENLVVYAYDGTNHVVLEDAVIEDGYLIVTNTIANYHESPIAIYGDLIVPEEDIEDDKEDDKSPETGDSTAIAFAILMMAIAAAGVVATKKARA